MNNEIKVKKIKPTGIFTNYIFKAIPLAFDESMSYYETLCGLLALLKNSIIPALNNNADVVIELQNFVANYFKNLDVQEEINNKLDEMAESGQLTDIIAQYLQLAGVLAYNNVNDMKNATNLVNGSFAQTLGFYNYNDGGGAKYKIRNVLTTDIVDNKMIIPINDNLIAELIYDELNVLQIGFKGNDYDDDSINFNSLNTIINNYNIKTVNFPNRIYKIENEVNFNVNNVNFNFNGKIHISSSNISETNKLNFDNSSNCIINNLYVYSDLDQIEPAPTDHVRQNYTGSNIIGLKLTNSNNLTFNNLTFENMYWDLYFIGSTQNKTKNIIFNNYKSINSSMCVYGKNTEYIWFNKSNIKLKNELGKGNHAFYFSNNCNNLYFNNNEIEADGYIGEIYHFYTGEIHNFIDVKISNCHIKAPSLIIIERSDNILIENINIDYVKALIDLPRMFEFKNNCNAYVNNIKVNGLSNNTTFLKLSDNNNIKINNLINTINILFDSNNNNFIDIQGDNNILLTNSNIETNKLLYISGSRSNNKIIIENVRIKTINDDYLISNRSLTSEVYFINDVINFVNNIPLTYNENVIPTPNSFKIFNTYLYNCEKLSETSYLPGFRLINAYIDETIIN